MNSSGNYSNARVQSWSAVQHHLFLHPNDAFIPHIPSRNYQQVSPLYIALRNEIDPVPVHIIDTLLRINPNALTDDLIVNVACRNPRMTGECMSRLLQMKPGFVTRRYRWHTPLHAIVRRARSVEAVRALILANPGGLSMRDSNNRIPLHVACCEGSFPIVQLLIEEGKKWGLSGGGLFVTDEGGMSPFHCAIGQMEFLERARIESDRHIYLNSDDFINKCYDSWKILVACLLGAYELKGETPLNSVHNFCWDESKVLVAAVALAGFSKKENRESSSSPLFSQMNWNQIFGLLLNPRFCDTHELASATDHKNRLPFITAIENELKFSDGLLHILKANPDAIFVNDIPEALLPQMMIILRQKLGLAVMYTLLINSPTVLNRDFGHLVTKRWSSNAQDDDEKPNKKQRAGSIQCL